MGLWREGELAAVLRSAPCLDRLNLSYVPVHCLSEMNGIRHSALREVSIEELCAGLTAGDPNVVLEADFPRLTAFTLYNNVEWD